MGNTASLKEPRTRPGDRYENWNADEDEEPVARTATWLALARKERE